MKLNKLKLFLLVLFIGLTGFVLFKPDRASAAPIIYYEMNQIEGSCFPGDTMLITPWARNGKTYYCAVRPEGAATYASVTTNPPSCPAGQPMFNDPAYGFLCITGYPGGSPKWGVGPATATSSDPVGNIQPRVSVAVDCETEPGESLNAGNCGIYKYLVLFINTLSGLVGIVIVLMIILGGIQYASSADDPAKVQAAKKRIFNALLALVSFIFLFAFLQWIVPGGVFN